MEAEPITSVKDLKSEIIETNNQNEESKKIQNYNSLFKCYLCNIYAKYNYYGNKPVEHYFQKFNLNVKDTIVLLENAYVCDDPFSDTKTSYLILGSKCYICKQMICISNECSLFYYNKRFCIKCAVQNINEFPNELKLELNKQI